MNSLAIVKNYLVALSLVGGIQLVAMDIIRALKKQEKLDITNAISRRQLLKLAPEQQKEIQKEVAEMICNNRKIVLNKNISLCIKGYINEVHKAENNNIENNKDNLLRLKYNLLNWKYTYAALQYELAAIQKNEKKMGIVKAGLKIAKDIREKYSESGVKIRNNKKKRVHTQTEGAKEFSHQKRRKLDEGGNWK